MLLHRGDNFYINAVMREQMSLTRPSGRCRRF